QIACTPASRPPSSSRVAGRSAPLVTVAPGERGAGGPWRSGPRRPREGRAQSRRRSGGRVRTRATGPPAPRSPRRPLARRRPSRACEGVAEAQAGQVAPQVALEAAAAEMGEEVFLVVHAVAGEEPVAALARGERDALGEAVADRWREVEVWLVERFFVRYLAA